MIESIANFELLTPASTAFGVLATAGLFALAWFGVPAAKAITNNTARRVLTNSAVPMGAQLGNRMVDLVFAAFMLRELGVAGNGRYAVAVIVWLYVKTISDFGLGVLTTREVARDPSRAGNLLGGTTLLRLAVLLLLVPFVAAYAFGGVAWLGLSKQSAIAIGLLSLSIVPGSYAEAVNSVFNGHERMELPAFLNVFTNFARFGFGVAALLAGTGVIGLATVSVFVTTLSALAFHIALRHLRVRPTWSLSFGQSREIIALSWPLLLNALLVNLFFRADVIIIQASQGDRALGTYDAAYKFINMLLLIPSYFTLAVFPLLTRHAAAGTDRLVDSFALAAKLLLIVALPIMLATMLLAPTLIRVLGGDAFLPGSAQALRVLIWFLPLSYVNGITQYVLIATNRQRSISLAFAFAVLFNLGANLVLVPAYGYLAAAAVTVATEVVLFIPLSSAFRRYVSPFNWLTFAARPVFAATLMGAALYLFAPFGVVPALAIGSIVYTVGLVASRAVGPTEAEIARAIAGRSKPAVP
jgi:O-antigen/teichoic acid export membrane protein